MKLDQSCYSPVANSTYQHVLMEMNQDSLLASEWNKMEKMVQVFEVFASHTDVLQTGVSSLSIIILSLLNLECHLQQPRP